MRASVQLAALIFPVIASAEVSKDTVLHSKHDLSVSSTATIHSSGEAQVCIFCHTPHSAQPNAPLWNHTQSAVSSYGLYTSTTLRSTITQPTSSDVSKLCLSCHDGTVALGDTVSDGLIPMVQGNNYTLPASAASNIYKGTGFGDDHPFAFVPASASEIQNPTLNDPVALDKAGKVQCITCHEPHNEFIDPTVGRFLVKSNAKSALCLTCHIKTGWTTASHQQPASTTDDSKYTSATGAHTGYTGVANNGCECCHRPHTPAVGQRLIKGVEENVCFQCHNGAVADSTKNIQAELQNKTYTHPVLTTPSVHDDAESPSSSSYRLPETSAGAPRHAECPDCHNPHAANATAASPPSVSGYQLLVKGVSSSGAWLTPASNQYEICFKCHGDSANKPQYFDTGNIGIGYGRNPKRQLDNGNGNRYSVRIEFTSMVAWHPVVQPRGLSTGLNGEVPSLRPYMITPTGSQLPGRTLSSSVQIYCTDCHNNSSGRNLGTSGGPVGVHGSNNVHLLERTYTYNIPPLSPGTTITPIPYSSTAYALCDKCHDIDNSILQNQSFKEHDKHVRGEGVSCAVCHDGHGANGGTTTNNDHLINFDLSIVAPSSSGILRYDDTGFHAGQCYLTCHGRDHNPETYKP